MCGKLTAAAVDGAAMALAHLDLMVGFEVSTSGCHRHSSSSVGSTHDMQSSATSSAFVSATIAQQ